VCLLERDREGEEEGEGEMDGWTGKAFYEKKAVVEMRVFYYYLHIIPRSMQILGTSL